MQIGMIHKLIELFQQAFDQLDVRIPMNRIEHMAVIVHKAMTVQARNFHNLEHVFNFIDQTNPIQTLAALFHDIVYYQVDPGFLPEIHVIIDAYILEQDEAPVIRQNISAEERMVWMTMGIFDLEAGERLTPAGGLNEFLSALMMNKLLEGDLTEKDLLRMTLCIEATIPFRGVTEGGESHYHILARRLRKIGDAYNIAFTWPEIDQAVQLAVQFANKDVENFSESDAGKFLDNTWKLLPEMNAALRSSEVYSVREYRLAIQRMEAFLSKLDPDNVFHSYRGVPSDEEYGKMVVRAHQNIYTARQYLRVKLLGQAVLDALAQVTGGDAPLCLFMGDLPRENNDTQRAANFLPDLEVPGWIDPGATVYQLLDTGRHGNSTFDLRTAPLSLFIYKSLEPDEFNRTLDLAKEMFSGILAPQDFLAQTSPKVVSYIARACAAMASTRRELLKPYLANNS
jgi:hypothetical protein